MKKTFSVLILTVLIFFSSVCHGDESALFLSDVDPDALIIVDISGSMGWTPAGDTLYNQSSSCSKGTAFYATSGSGHTNSCQVGQWDAPKFGDDENCAGPYYHPSSYTYPSGTTGCTEKAPSGHAVNCSRHFIAQRAIKKILDADGNGTVDNNDYNILKIRFGYMRFLGCAPDVYGFDYAGNYSSGCIQKKVDIGADKYGSIWSTVSSEKRNYSGTHLAETMNEAKSYLDYHKSTDDAKACRQKFVIFITDGADTLTCNGTGSESQSDQYKRRKATVAKAKILADAGYKVFMVGFGAVMPEELRYTLEWAAYFGGTYNPSVTQTGDTSAIQVSSDPCNEGSVNDPATAPLSGYALLATNASELNQALNMAVNLIRESIYTFSVTSVAASRTPAENYLYEASFKPMNSTPMWRGYLTKYALNTDGSVGSVVWEAGQTLKSKDPATRNMFTYKNGAFFDFKIGTSSGTKASDWQTYLGASSTTHATEIVGYIRGEDAYNPDKWKLGDIFHSGPIFIGSPSNYYIDIRYPSAFETFRTNNKTRERLIVVGANDGQFHGFQAASSDGTEKWSFIPPNLLKKLQYLAHMSDLTMAPHSYFVDGQVSVADVWLGSGDGTTKDANDWTTLLVFGQGKGVRDNSNNTAFLWSSSASCDSNFQNTYDSTYKYYCGYYALVVTATAASRPAFKWIVKPQNDAQGKYMGEPWSKMVMGRVVINGSEKWVGFIGGGYGLGQAFFVVNLSDGNILWSYTRDNPDVGIPDMSYAIPATPAIVDLDNDGFIDRAYVGDLGGNMWKFDFCKKDDGTNCNIANWKAKGFYQASTARPIYVTPSIAQGSVWVMWGTGDKEDPKNSNTNDSFYAVEDEDLSSPITGGDLENITQEGKTYQGKKPGWKIDLAKGEKVIFDPAVFAGIVFFTTYTPPSGSDPCEQSGTARLYAIAMTRLVINGVTYDPGAGVLTEPANKSSTAGGQRSIVLGSGMAKSPVFSQKPAPGGPTDFYISLSGGESGNTQIISTSQLGDSPLKNRLADTAPSSQMIHWKDGRIQ
jgi:type IV pilus assembly protein PilY1